MSTKTDLLREIRDELRALRAALVQTEYHIDETGMLRGVPATRIEAYWDEHARRAEAQTLKSALGAGYPVGSGLDDEYAPETQCQALGHDWLLHGARRVLRTCLRCNRVERFEGEGKAWTVLWEPR
jgi:hypothetical protein